MLNTFALGLLFYLVSLGISLVAIFVCFKVVVRITRYDDIGLLKKNNPAAAAVIGASFIAMAIMLKSAIYPATASLQDFWFIENKSLVDFWFLALRVGGVLVITTVVSLFSIAAALRAFHAFTREIDEENEVLQGNISVAVVVSCVLIAFALLMEPGISDLVNTLLPEKKLFN